ncbi:MFS transporter [Oryzobacter telluris]|uniref:MFS transporter n=1 Tax=Oryzobacter telluris TaxID=3149179 RepID=UPI00370DBDBD
MPEPGSLAEAAPPTAARRPLWRDRRFLTSWSAQSVSELGDRVSELAVPLVAVTVLDASATEVGLLSAVIWLPNLVALVVGAWVDRRPRKRPLLVGADLARAAVVLTVPAAALLDVLTLAQLFVVALLLGAWSTLFRSAWQPFFVALVRRDQYVEANGLMSATRSGSFIVGPAVGGGLVQLLTAPFALAVDGLSFLASALLLRRVDVTETPPVVTDDDVALRTRLADGMRLVLRHPVLAPALRSVAWVNLFTIMVSALLIVFAARDLGLDAATIGLALGIGSGGALLGAVAAGRIARWIGTGRTIALGTLLFTAPMALVPLAGGSTLAKAAVLAGVEAVSGFGVMLLDVNLNAVMAAVIPDDVRARVQGAFTTVNYGTRPLGAAVGGILAGVVGTGPTLVIGGVGGALGVLWLLGTPVVRIRSIDDLEDPNSPPRPP